MADPLFEPLLVNGPQLLQQDHGILDHIAFPRRQFHMRWQLCLIHAGGNCRTDHGRTVSVSNIILDDEHRPYTALLRAYHRPQVRIIDIASSDNHSFTLRHWSSKVLLPFARRRIHGCPFFYRLSYSAKQSMVPTTLPPR